MYIGVLTPVHLTPPFSTTSQLLHNINLIQSPPPIMTVYHAKANIEPLLNYVILVIDMPKDTKFHKRYTQAWTNVTLIFLQRSKIYNLL